VLDIQGIFRSVVFLLICALPIGLHAQLCNQWADAVQAGQLKDALNEESEMAVSRQFPGRLYHINDSGDTGRFYITGMDGRGTKPVRVSGFNPEDTEALSLGPCPAGGRGSCLYLGDIGDNDSNRKSIEIVIIEELKDFPQMVAPRNTLKLRYPDRAHDAESMAIHPNGTIYILTKEQPAALFKANLNAREQTLVPVRTLDVGSKPTDMAISDDGARLLVLTYADAVEYSMDLKQQQKIRLNFLQQQESVAYLPGSRSFLYSTERLLPMLPQWIMRSDCVNQK